MTRIIAVSSGKGGVGKTTVVANLATALAQYNKSVVALDANLTTSNLGIHLGIHLYPNTLHDVLEKKARISDVIYYHNSGLKVIPADISMRKMKDMKVYDFMDILYRILNEAEFILIDTAAGLGKEALTAIEAADDMITVTNPDMPSVVDAMKLDAYARRLETRNLGVIVNRVRRESHELPLDYIESFLKIPVLGEVPEDKAVRASIAHKQPVIIYDPKSLAAQYFKSIAARFIGKDYKPKIPLRTKIFSRF